MSPSRKREKALRKAAIILFVLPIPLLIWMTSIAPFELEVTHFEIEGPVKSPITIAHLSDLHTNGLEDQEENVFRALEQEKPDLIVHTGDLIWRKMSYPNAHAVLKKLSAPLGVVVVRGNWEVKYPVLMESEYYRSAGVTFLDNANYKVRDDLEIVGLDDFRGKPNVQKAVHGLTKPCIAIFHSPELFSSIQDHCFLSLAGHTHGGQVRIPGLPPLWLPPGTGKYLEGWYEEGKSKLYISRGIGTSLIRIRFFSKPELAIIKIVPKP